MFFKQHTDLILFLAGQPIKTFSVITRICTVFCVHIMSRVWFRLYYKQQT